MYLLKHFNVPISKILSAVSFLILIDLSPGYEVYFSASCMPENVCQNNIFSILSFGVFSIYITLIQVMLSDVVKLPQISLIHFIVVFNFKLNQRGLNLISVGLEQSLVYGQLASLSKDSADLCYFSRAAIKHYHRLGGLKQQKFILAQFWRLEVKSEVS